jgi:hypothetical protein
MGVGLLAAAPACGYRVLAPGGGLPEGVRQVCAPVLGNRTAEPAAEALFTSALRRQLLRAGVAAEGTCDATVHGQLLRLVSGVGVFDLGGAATYRATAALQLTLSNGERTLGQVTLEASEDYLAGEDPVQSEANRDAALRRLADELTREAWDLLASQGG